MAAGSGNMQFASIQQLVNENSVDDFIRAVEVLQKFAGNILKNPNEPKYRKIRLGNPVVESKLLPVSGALECLFEMGFVEDGEHLTLPITASIKIVREMHDMLVREREVAQRSKTPATSMSQETQRLPAAPTQRVSGQTAGSENPLAGMSPNQIHQSEMNFQQKLHNSMSHVLTYEDASLQMKALQVIPVSQLEEEAKQQLDAQNQTNSQAQPGVKPLDFRDFLLVVLLNWFKNSFFKWVDAPDCEFCGGKTSAQGMAEPTAAELFWGGNRVENYKCATCHKFTRFPRYNAPSKLLETRRGRCGEWANCFTLCCRAMNFEARYVLDWTDHVWTEVYSESQQRWLHSDPCENTCDKPLLYEVGWGKKLTYIIAFGKDGIQDVTWRYSADHPSLLKRRRECRESWLVSRICDLQERFWKKQSESRRQILMERTVVELVEFMTPKKADKENLSGRTSGSLAWRTSRGEMGSQKNTPYIFKLSDMEKEKKCLHVIYNCAGNQYVRISDGGTHIAGYHSLVNSLENIFRKEEMDWKMVYLARTEGSDKAEIAWKFDFADSGLEIDKIEIRVDGATYENGRIHWMVCSDESCAMVNGGPELQTITDLQGQREFTLTASLSGGKGNVAWQHTQLFRQANNDTNSRPFEVKVTLK